jgi:phage host-nuclease inhibitor protein Gam
MGTKKATLSPVVIVPNTLAEANVLLMKLGEYERDLAATALTLEAAIAGAKEAANQIAGPIEAVYAATEKALLAYATRERKSLLPGSKKSVILPGGEFGWRTTPGKVSISKVAAESIVDNLKSLGLTKYLRVTTEVDREALLKDRPTLSGVRYAKTEKFYVKPATEKAPENFPGDARMEA